MLVWVQNNQTGDVFAKLAYDLIIEKENIDSSCWWTKWLWKEHCPLKIKIFMWICIKKKILTWDVL